MARGGLALPLLIVAIIAQGDFFRPALAFTSLPFVTKSCTARTHVLQRTKGRSKHVTVPTSRIVAEGWELPALGEIKEYRLDYTEAADTSLGVAATAVESGPESNEGVKRVADARTAPRLEFDWKLAREQGRHRYEMAKQRMELLEGMVPLSAHQAIVDSYEKECKAAIVETAASGAARLRGVADDFAKSREETAARLRAKDEALANASAQVRVMSEGLEGLKRDVHALRTALGSHAARAEASRRALADEIRQSEVEPERRRADSAETALSELRRSAHSWLATAHAMKLEATAEARAEGYLLGIADGRSQATADSLQRELSLRTEMEELRDDFAKHRAQSREKSLALTIAVSEARQDAYTMIAAAADAGAGALAAARGPWMAEGRAEGHSEGLARGRAEGLTEGRVEEFREGFAAGRAEGLSEGREEGVKIGRKSTAMAVELSTVTAMKVDGAGGDTAVTQPQVKDGLFEGGGGMAATAEEDAGRELREAFAAYVVSAHDQKLSFAQKEKAAAEETARGLEEELAAAREVLAQVLEERISEMESSRRFLETDDESAQGQPLNTTLLRTPVWLDAAAGLAEQRLGSPAFWQECGGAQQ